mmetsp:Transcript_63679/g.178100  ORF Transcript_63679/g.178100 Transcript_63679/m.178100 type:complete len:115 (-) Transcript_63679:102-446(-)
MDAALSQDDRQRQLVATGRRLEETGAVFRSTARTALETEELANGVLRDLNAQREQLDQVNVRVGEVNSSVSGARGVIAQMNRRASLKKAVLSVMTLLLAVALGVVVYFVFFSKQ